MVPALDAPLFVRWVAAAADGLERHRAEIDRINVFPVADGDTGSNMLLTLRAALAEVEGAADPAAALAKGALTGARGNSGVLLSQVLRGVADAVADRGDLAAALDAASVAARSALSRPRPGTILTVLEEAAGAAAGKALPAAAAAAADAAERAVRQTTAQLPELARAGVVDAGGLGLYVVLDALAGLVTDREPTETVPLPATTGRPPLRSREALVGDREGGSVDFEYEVMYLLDGVNRRAADVLRDELDELGDSVAVVGDGAGTWNVHVHCSDVGAVIEAGLTVGRPRRITVVRFGDTPAPGAAPPDAWFVKARAVLMVVTGAEVAELAGEAGAQVLERDPDQQVGDDELAAALAATRARHVVLLPDDAELTTVAEKAAAKARRTGQDVVVIPTSSVLQGLSALAVHDPHRRAGDDVVAMAEAAAGTRTAGLMVAESEALTWVGRCEPGDVLGISDGEVVLIAPDLAVGALWLAHRMLTAGGEIVTALLGADADPALGEGLALDLRRTHPEVDVIVHRGGQTDFPLVLGVE
ncbi:DAK2 domain-containing protein [Pseudonocardia sp. CA-107938]|uniref:DAK2 domain-containing protein n=1 Tax=Pseudonocardia sp. CA-107938 TaxID=3240021 RepID=UPI003D8BC230